jgi:hypothetical protein
MNKTNNIRIVSALGMLGAALGAAAGGLVSGGIYNLSFADNGANASVTFGGTLPGILDVTTAPSGFTMGFTATPPAGLGSTFLAFCCDVTHYIGSPIDYQASPLGSLYSPTTPFAAGGIQRAAYLALTYSSPGSTTAAQEQNAAVQTAIWTVLYNPPAPGGTTFPLTGGQFTVTFGSGGDNAGVELVAETLLADPKLTGDLSSYKAWVFAPMDSNGHPLSNQAVLGVVPEPADFGVVFGGLLGAFGFGRRMLKRQS